MSAIAVAMICLAVGVTDGDTIKARCGEPGAYEEVKVRMGGIDAPERGQAFGERSKQALSDLVYMKPVTLDCTKQDRYRRHVCNVSTAATGDVGLAMVSAGMAWWYRAYAREQTPAARGLYERAEADAMRGKRGLWIDEGTAVPPVAPWDLRKVNRNARNRAL